MSDLNFIGNAVAIKDAWTVTVANTWAAADTATLTINGKDLVVTIGSLVTTAEVAVTIKQAWQSEAFTDTTASCSPSGGGTTIPEMAELTATVSGSVVTLTADTAGVKHTISVTESTAGTGTATGAHAITATGPSYVDNIDNYAEGAAPAGTEDLYIDRAVSMLYATDQNAITLNSLNFLPGMTSTAYVGLPFRNANGYEEYREDELKIGATTVNCRATSGRIKLNVGTVQCAANIYTTGTSAESNRRAFQWRGTHASNVVNVFGGDVGIGANNEAATVATIRQTGGTLEVGANVTATTISKGDGTMILRCAATTVTNDAGTLTHWGGAITTLNNTGTFYENGAGTITTANLYNKSILDLSGSAAAITITTINVYGEVAIIDPQNRLTITNTPTVQRGGKLTFKKTA